MAKIQDEIIAEFLEKLKGSEEFSDEHVARLRNALQSDKKLKAIDLMTILADAGVARDPD